MYQEQDVFQKDLDNILFSDKINPVKWIANFFSKTIVIAEFEVRKLRHDYIELFTTGDAACFMDACIWTGFYSD